MTLPESLTPILHCRSCGQVLACPPEDALRYVAAGWPDCCGEVMGLYCPAAKPTDLASPRTPSATP